uniref:Uncharacterized protein n=1 Tax=Lepeophtheirus salmonis TaxID=72036 RepID=A0A0K2U364_LEPSM
MPEELCRGDEATVPSPSNQGISRGKTNF